MPLTITDPATLAVLAAATTADEVRSPDGRLLGRFVPAPRPGVSFPELGLTDEELERLENDPNAKWYSPAEVMARLRDLRGPG
jgi:hypothetical protein